MYIYLICFVYMSHRVIGTFDAITAGCPKYMRVEKNQFLLSSRKM